MIRSAIACGSDRKQTVCRRSDVVHLAERERCVVDDRAGRPTDPVRRRPNRGNRTGRARLVPTDRDEAGPAGDDRVEPYSRDGRDLRPAIASVENDTVLFAAVPGRLDSMVTIPRSDDAALAPVADSKSTPVVRAGGPHVGSGPGGQVGPAGGGGGPVR